MSLALSSFSLYLHLWQQEKRKSYKKKNTLKVVALTSNPSMQEDYEFKASLDYMASPFKKQKTKKQQGLHKRVGEMAQQL